MGKNSEYQDHEGVKLPVHKDRTLKPIVAWAGGKRQLLGDILPMIPQFNTYVEPFVGGGAVLLSLQPKDAIINDSNTELINMYVCIRDHPEGVMEILEKHKKLNSADHFYKVRALDREPGFEDLPPVERAARIIYLNKTCYNGLYRVNSKGQFNSAYNNRRKNPEIVNEPAIKAMSTYLNGDVEILCGDYSQALKGLRKGAFVYLDPPYMPISASSSFTGYTAQGFGYDEQVRLKEECDKLVSKGIHFIQSNSDCPEIRALYSDYEILTVKAKRSINCKGTRRGAINEVLIRG